MSHQTVTAELRRWIVSQSEAGCRTEDLIASMIRSGWSEDIALAAIEAAGAERGLPVAAALAAAAVPEPALAGAPTLLRTSDRELRVLATLALPRIVVFGGLLSDEECDALVELARPRLARSETVDNTTGGSEVNAARTSDGMFFERGETALIERIERRIAELVNWPVERGEGLQVLRYRPGAQYKPHHDFFDPAHPGTAGILRRGGQRVATVVMYLNTPAGGGATTFPEVGLEVQPVKGNAVFFSYERPLASTRTLHGGAPVLDGEKWVATKWLREGVFA
ncbi:2-oxoglutarate-dependent dioxygenase [Rubrivivax gelatinosus]|nr:2-oxoglutarate-dependent dioxygenase [Rubrivivax gelatinosus]